MGFNINKKKIIQILFGIAIGILIANIVADKIFNTPGNNQKEISGNIINVKFLNSLRSFGIKNEWIKRNKTDKKDNAGYSYDVEIPKDLPITIILDDIYDNFDSSKVKIKSTEKVIGGETILNISTSNKLKLKASFNYNDEIERSAGVVGLVITGIGQLNKIETEKLLESPNAYALVIKPSKSSVEFASRIRKDKKEFVVLLNDDINDLEYKLKSNFSTKRFNNVMKTIVQNFSNSIFFMIDNNSDLYNSDIYSKIKRQFRIRGIKLIPQDSLQTINTDEQPQLSFRFASIVKKLTAGKRQLILLNANQYNLLQQEISNLRKIGYKFINPSLVIYPPKK